MKIFRFSIVVFLACQILISCKKGETGRDSVLTLLPASVTKIDFENRLTETEEMNIIEYLYFNNGAGVAAGDINNDGLTDLYFSANQLSNRLYLNRGNLQFEDITGESGTAGKGSWKTEVAMADVNGDGFLDIYVCQVGDYKSLKGRNQLFINNGDLSFSEQAEEYGLDFRGFSTQAAFFDYDADGDLDMYLLTHSVHSSRSYGRVDLRFEEDEQAGDKLFRNDEVNGRRYFRDVTDETGIFSSQIGYGLGVSISDINNDGFPDIYVSNDFHEDDYLYINNGNGTFTEMLSECIAHTSRSSMGNDIADFNNDGLTDILVLDMLPDVEEIRKRSGGEDDYELFNIKLQYGYHHQFVRNTLQLNLGQCVFSEIGQLAGIYSTDWSWSPLFCDLDNDGWKDIFISSGIYRRGNDLDYIDFLTGGNRFFPVKENNRASDKDLYEKMPLYPNVNYIFRNNGDMTFEKLEGEWNKVRSYSNGSAYADLDNDGDLELIVNRINEKAVVYKNEASKAGNHYLALVLKGTAQNTHAVGSKITVYTDSIKQIAEQFTTRGFMSSSSEILHFGLGKSDWIDSVIIRWPDNSLKKLGRIRADTILTIRQEGTSQTEQESLLPPRLFIKDSIPGFEFIHNEDKRVDFLREPLIPHSLSAEGPSLAVGDINGDQLDDVFVGGAKGQKSSLLIQAANGHFRRSSVQAFERLNISDNVDALFFDADGDKDADLYLVKGGNEYPAGHPFLFDQLLLNDGKGNFISKKGFYLSHNGSCVRAADFDQDGDPDLFVGTRSVPGYYGLPPEQFLLRNEGKGDYSDVTTSIAKELRNIGMVTDACWLDYDADNDPDLLVVGEWMRISLFRNDEGKFTDVTSEVGFEGTAGWWSSVECTDIDHDGAPDIIAGNLGLNSMLKASPQEPVTLYLNDFDNSGSLDPIICTSINNIYYPFASLDELNVQIKGMKNRFPVYADFAGKSVEEVFGAEALQQSLVLKAEQLESCIFINNGKGVFSKKELPKEAQFSPIRDILTGDFNNDGVTDLLLAGNNYQARPSLGRYDASYGWFLAGNGPGSFRALMPSESGFIVKGDARKVFPVRINNRNYVITAVNNGSIVLSSYYR